MFQTEIKLYLSRMIAMLHWGHGAGIFVVTLHSVLGTVYFLIHSGNPQKILLSQLPATCPYSKTDQSNQSHLTLKVEYPF
jgi:hypothetical protein